MLSSLKAVISTDESAQFITGLVIYNPAYTYKFQLKTTLYTVKQIRGKNFATSVYMNLPMQKMENAIERNFPQRLKD